MPKEKGNGEKGNGQLLRWAIYGFTVILITVTFTFWKFSKEDVSAKVSKPVFEAHEKAFEEYKKIAEKEMTSYTEAFSEFKNDTNDKFIAQDQRFEKRIDRLERNVEKRMDKLDSKMDRILGKLE